MADLKISLDMGMDELFTYLGVQQVQIVDDMPDDVMLVSKAVAEKMAPHFDQQVQPLPQLPQLGEVADVEGNTGTDADPS